jgi:hypothetical protein
VLQIAGGAARWNTIKAPAAPVTERRCWFPSGPATVLTALPKWQQTAPDAARRAPVARRSSRRSSGVVPFPERRANSSWVRAIAMCHPIRRESHGRFRGTEEPFGRGHISGRAEHGVDQVSVPVDRPTQIAPLALNLEIRLVDVPADAWSPPGAVPPLAESIFHNRQQLRLPVPNGLTDHHEPAQQEDFAQIPEGQPVAQTAEDHEAYNVARQAGPVQHAAAALVELLAAVPAAEPPVALSCDLPTLRDRRRSAADTIYSRHSISLASCKPYQITHRSPNNRLARDLTEPVD